MEKDERFKFVFIGQDEPIQIEVPSISKEEFEILEREDIMNEWARLQED